jgi:hypothetical protein
MFLREVFGKCQPIDLCFLRSFPGGVDLAGLPSRPAWKLTLAAADRETSPRYLFLEDAHCGSHRSVACLNDARLERSLECSRRDEPISAARSTHTRGESNPTPAVAGGLSRRHISGNIIWLLLLLSPGGAFRSRLTEPITETTLLKQPSPFIEPEGEETRPTI